MKSTVFAALKLMTVIAILVTGLTANAGMTLKCSPPSREELEGQLFLVIAGAGAMTCYGVDSKGKIDPAERYEVSFGAGGLGLEAQGYIGVTMKCWGDWPEFEGQVAQGDYRWVDTYGAGMSCGLALAGGQVGMQMDGKKRGCFIYGFQAGLGGSVSIKGMTMIKRSSSK
jgi:hypothetical protein